MISLATARVVVVADDAVGAPFVHVLTRMGLADVRHAASAQAAHELCTARHADACLVVVCRPVPDEAPRWPAGVAAPEIPALLIADIVTPYLAKQARSSGYVAVVPARLPPRLLYRHICALLQKARRQDMFNCPAPGEPETPRQAAFERPVDGAGPGEPTLQ